MKKFFSFLMVLFMLPPSITLIAQTPDYIYRQGYLFDPTTNTVDSIGVGAANVLSIAGSDGAGITIFDIESAWNLNHEDLPSQPQLEKVFGDDVTPADHGTATLGVFGGSG